MTNNVLVIGDGLLGSEIIKQTEWNYISRKKNGIDFNNIETLIDPILDANCSQILNCVAFTDTYSNNKNLHWKTNYESVMKLVDLSNYIGAKFIHISTDYTYANSIEFASEDDIPVHARNWYSYTKLLGDAYVQARANLYLLIRTSFKPKPFPYEKAITSQCGNFDYVDVIAKMITILINNQATGVYNVGTQMKTIYDLALQTKPNIQPSDHKIHDSMPENITMNIDKLTRFMEVHNAKN